jgi:putative oxidoreductase
MGTVNDSNRIPHALFILRVTVFLVMLMWTIDKFARPDHAAAVFGHFYTIDGLGHGVMYILGGAELLLLAAFVLGVARRFTYGMVLVLHAISTLSSYRQYLHPFEEGNLLFFAAWPMLGACFALYYLRNLDTCCRIPDRSK